MNEDQALDLADKLLALINSQSRTPSRLELAKLIMREQPNKFAIAETIKTWDQEQPDKLAIAEIIKAWEADDVRERHESWKVQQIYSLRCVQVAKNGLMMGEVLQRLQDKYGQLRGMGERVNQPEGEAVTTEEGC